MESKINGWVIISDNHPVTGRRYIVESTFSRLRKDAITEFCKGSGRSWSYWRKKFNFKAVKATSYLKINTV